MILGRPLQLAVSKSKRVITYNLPVSGAGRVGKKKRAGTYYHQSCDVTTRPAFITCARRLGVWNHVGTSFALRPRL